MKTESVYQQKPKANADCQKSDILDVLRSEYHEPFNFDNGERYLGIIIKLEN